MKKILAIFIFTCSLIFFSLFSYTETYAIHCVGPTVTQYKCNWVPSENGNVCLSLGNLVTDCRTNLTPTCGNPAAGVSENYYKCELGPTNTYGPGHSDGHLRARAAVSTWSFFSCTLTWSNDWVRDFYFYQINCIIKVGYYNRLWRKTPSIGLPLNIETAYLVLWSRSARFVEASPWRILAQNLAPRCGETQAI